MKVNSRIVKLGLSFVLLCILFSAIYITSCYADGPAFSFTMNLVTTFRQDGLNGTDANNTVHGYYENGVVVNSEIEALPALEDIGGGIPSGYKFESWGGYPAGMSLGDLITLRLQSHPDFIYDPTFTLSAWYTKDEDHGKDLEVVIQFHDSIFGTVVSPRIHTANSDWNMGTVPDTLQAGQIKEGLTATGMFKYWTCNGQIFNPGDDLTAFAKELVKTGSGTEVRVTMEAQWQIVSKCKVIYDYNDGSGRIMSEDGYINLYGTISLSLPSVTHINPSYSFAGWFRKDGTPVGDKITGASGVTEITLYAHWNQSNYIFNYHDDLGHHNYNWSGAVGDVSNYTIPDYYSSNKNRITIYGANGAKHYQITGYRCAEDGNLYPAGTKYIDIAKKNNIQTVTINIEYYEMLSGYLTYDYNLVKKSAETVEVFIDKTTRKWDVALPVPSAGKDGYTFIGWFTSGGTRMESYFTYYGSEITLIAQWEKEKYVLSVWETLNTGEISVCTFGPDDTVTLPKNSAPNKSGSTTYRFLGWSYNSNPAGNVSGIDFAAGQKVEAQKLIPHCSGKKVILYAVWTQEPVVRVYISNEDTHSLMFYNQFETINGYIPEKDRHVYVTPGYNITWYTDTSWTSQTSLDARFTENTSVYGLERANDYTVNYHLVHPTKGLMSTTRSEKVKYTESFTIPSCTWASISGYSFAGWSSSPNGSIRFTAGQTVSKLVDTRSQTSLDLYSVWTANKFKINFSPNGGKGSIPGIEAVYGKEVGLPAGGFTKDKAVLRGWSRNANAVQPEYSLGQSTSFVSVAANKDITLYAVWESQSYKIIFNANGGTGYMDTLEVNAEEQFTMPSALFKKAGYNFAGWNTSTNGTGQMFMPGTYIAKKGTIILYAQWTTKKTFNIILDYNYPDGSSYQETKVKEDKPLTLILPTLKSDYGDFKGWKFEGTILSGNQQYTFKENRNIVLTAQWDQKLTIRFQANGGGGSMSDYKVDVGKSFVLPANRFTRTGYTFAGWRTSSGGTYADCASLKATSHGTIYLKALWSAEPTYSVSFHYNYPGGQNYIKTFTKVKGIPLTVNVPKPSSYGGTFLNWSGTGVYLGKDVNTYTFTADHNIDLYGIWQVKTRYTYSFYSYGTLVAGESKYSGEYITLGSLGKQGAWTFDHWVDNNGKTYTANQRISVGASNKSFTAVWRSTAKRWIAPTYSSWYSMSSNSSNSYYNLDEDCRRNFTSENIYKTVDDYGQVYGSWYQTSSNSNSNYNKRASDLKRNYRVESYSYEDVKSSPTSGYTARTKTWTTREWDPYDHWVIDRAGYYKTVYEQHWDIWAHKYITTSKKVWVDEVGHWEGAYYTLTHRSTEYYKIITVYTYYWEQRDWITVKIGSHQELDYVRYKWDWRTRKTDGYWEEFFVYQQ